MLPRWVVHRTPTIPGQKTSYSPPSLPSISGSKVHPPSAQTSRQGHTHSLSGQLSLLTLCKPDKDESGSCAALVRATLTEFHVAMAVFKYQR